MAIRALPLALLALGGIQLAFCTASPSPGFDLFVLVRSYSPTFCQETPCTINPVSAFTIHGLWPEYNNGLWPEFCDAANATTSGGAVGTEADSADPDPEPEPEPDPDEDDSEQQKCEWPSFKGSDAGFWDHEWQRHGTCARPITGDRPSFFQAVMRLHEKYDLDVALSEAGIEPSSAQTYTSARLSRAVEDAFGVRPMVSCFKGQLLELWLCVGLDLKVKPCPLAVRRSFKSTCGARISLPVGAPVPPQCKSYFPPWNARNSGGGEMGFVRIATGLAVAGAGAAAAALFWQGVKARRRGSLLASIPEERYDPLQSWP